MSMNASMKRRDWAELGVMVAICFGLMWMLGCAQQSTPSPHVERVIPPVGQTPPLCNYIEVRP